MFNLAANQFSVCLSWWFNLYALQKIASENFENWLYVTQLFSTLLLKKLNPRYTIIFSNSALNFSRLVGNIAIVTKKKKEKNAKKIRRIFKVHISETALWIQLKFGIGGVSVLGNLKRKIWLIPYQINKNICTTQISLKIGTYWVHRETTPDWNFSLFWLLTSAIWRVNFCSNTCNLHLIIQTAITLYAFSVESCY